MWIMLSPDFSDPSLKRLYNMDRVEWVGRVRYLEREGIIPPEGLDPKVARKLARKNPTLLVYPPEYEGAEPRVVKVLESPEAIQQLLRDGAAQQPRTVQRDGQLIAR